MKLKYKAALQFFLFGLVILLILAWTFDYHNHKVLTREALHNIETLSKESAQHINTHLKEKVTVALTLASAPTITEALLQSNREYGVLTSDKRTEEIDRLNQEWKVAKDSNAPFIQQHMTTPAAVYLKRQQAFFSETYGEIFLTNRYGVMIAATNRLFSWAGRSPNLLRNSHIVPNVSARGILRRG